jgi:ankyrin repeat protein
LDVTVVGAENGHEAVIRLLLEKGAEINAKGKFGWTPLSLAAGSGHEAVVRLLLEKGADINAEDEKGHEAVMRLLTHSGRGKLTSE